MGTDVSRASGGAKVVVAAAAAPSSLAVLALGGGAGLAVAVLVHLWLGLLVFLGACGAYGARVLSLAGDPAFGRRVLAAADPTRSRLTASDRLRVMQGFSRLSPAWQERVERLADHSEALRGSVVEGTGQELVELAPQCHQALEEAIELSSKGAALEAEGLDTTALQVRVDRIVGLLGEIRAELGTVDSGAALEGGMVPRLEDLTGEIRALEGGIEELENEDA